MVQLSDAATSNANCTSNAFVNDDINKIISIQAVCYAMHNQRCQIMKGVDYDLNKYIDIVHI